MLQQKKILLAVSGSIAAYKSASLVRLLIKAGADVKVLMTPCAKDFITPLTLATLSKNPVYSDVSSEEGWHNHVELGLWADAMVVAPATANTLAKMANGLCDNMVLAAYLSARCPVFFAPAMDLDMWTHPATQYNIQKLCAFPRHHLIPVEDGELASGLVGKGRMAEPEHIVQFLYEYFAAPVDQLLKGYQILMTSGPTVEPLDPVRFISNHSTGKMGTALAKRLAQHGAKVIFVSGPVREYPHHPGVELIKVKTAAEMYQAATQHFSHCQGAILTAAVADYTPAVVANEKIKKNSDQFHLELKKNPDIAASLGQEKQPTQFLVGFALETNNELENAKKKIQSKNLDFVVLNSLQDKGAGFGHDTNQITIVQRNGQILRYDLKSKEAVAEDICQALIQHCSGSKS